MTPSSSSSSDDARALAVRLCQRIGALPEAAMRRVVLAEALRDAAPGHAVDLIREVSRAAVARPAPPFTVAATTLALALGDEALFPYERRAALYAAAKEAGLLDVARLFFAAGPAPDGEPPAPEPEQVVEPRGRPLTLGERKSLARGPRGDLLLRLARDPDPAVIRVLLENPHVVERDVVLIASRRPVLRAVLEVVAASRWLVRHDVRRALVLNPYLSGDVAIRLLSSLNAADLRDVTESPNLSEPLRAQATLLLLERGR